MVSPKEKNFPNCLKVSQPFSVEKGDFWVYFSKIKRCLRRVKSPKTKRTLPEETKESFSCKFSWNWSYSAYLSTNWKVLLYLVVRKIPVRLLEKDGQNMFCKTGKDAQSFRYERFCVFFSVRTFECKTVPTSNLCMSI